MCKQLAVCVKRTFDKHFYSYLIGLCRHNEDALKQLEITSFLPVLLKLLQMPDQRLRAKTAFFLSHLASKENFRGNI